MNATNSENRSNRFTRITKNQIIKGFLHPAESSELLVTNSQRVPVLFIRTYPCENKWGCFKIGRQMDVFLDGKQSCLFRDNAKCIGNYKYIHFNTGDVKAALDYLAHLPDALFQVTVEDMQDELNINKQMSWVVSGKEIYVGQEVTITGYDDLTDCSYPDFIDQRGKVCYSFRLGKPELALNKPLKGFQVYCQGELLYTSNTRITTLPLEFVEIA